MKNTTTNVLIASLFGIAFASAQADCVSISQALSAQISSNKPQVLEIVSNQISQSPNCACEIVKAAIAATEAESAVVGSIVEAAITAAPEQLRLISQCAIAAAPDAIADVQAVLAKLDPNSGDSVASSKDAKDSKDAKGAGPSAPAPEAYNPLNGPGGTGRGQAVSTTPGSDNGGPGIGGFNPLLVGGAIAPNITPPVDEVPSITPPNPTPTIR